MSDLISRQAALDEFVDGRDVYDIMESIESLPSAERKTGQWDEYQTCSVCGKQADDFIEGYVDGIEYEPNYCPNCGADMRATGGEDDEHDK